MENCNSILIIEDEQEIREALQMLLELEGYHVVSATNGKEGLQILPLLKKPCLILLDLMMPIMNGFDFLEAKKEDVRIAPIPVVIVSAITDQKKTKDAVGYIRKPIDFSILVQAVREYCGLPVH